MIGVADGGGGLLSLPPPHAERTKQRAAMFVCVIVLMSPYHTLRVNPLLSKCNPLVPRGEAIGNLAVALTIFEGTVCMSGHEGDRSVHVDGRPAEHAASDHLA